MCSLGVYKTPFVFVACLFCLFALFFVVVAAAVSFYSSIVFRILTFITCLGNLDFY